MSSFVVQIIAMIPAVMICVYVFIMDRVEKEPAALLATLFGAGAVIQIAAKLIERYGLKAVNSIFLSGMTYGVSGELLYAETGALWGHHLTYAFLGVALVEVLLRWGTLYLLTWNNKEFDCLFDGLVYAAFLSLGFSLCDNLSYGISAGSALMLMRMLSVLPEQILVGVVMGSCYTSWRCAHLKAAQERRFGGGKAKKFGRPAAFWGVMSVAAPVLVHGLYCTMRLFRSHRANVMLTVFMVVLSLVCILLVVYYSASDSYFKEILKRAGFNDEARTNDRRSR